MSASDCIAAPAGIGSSASPTRAVVSYWRMRWSSGRASAHQRSLPPEPGRPLLDQLVHDVAHAALVSSHLDPRVTSAAGLSRPRGAQQPADDLAGVARQTRPRRQPLELAPHQRLPARVEHPPGAERGGEAGGRLRVDRVELEQPVDDEAVAAAVRRVEARRDCPRRRRRSTSGSGSGSASRSRGGGSAPITVATADPGGVSVACTANHLSPTSRSWRPVGVEARERRRRAWPWATRSDERGHPLGHVVGRVELGLRRRRPRGRAAVRKRERPGRAARGGRRRRRRGCRGRERRSRRRAARGRSPSAAAIARFERAPGVVDGERVGHAAGRRRCRR